MAQCESCGGDVRYGKCRECGAVDAHAATSVVADTPTACPFDGAPLMANGWCPTGNGYPITRNCPFVCDRCRDRLTWSGTCLSCLEYAPGDRYGDKDQHWRVVEKGPFVMLTRQQNAHMAAAFGETMTRLVARMSVERDHGLRP